MLRVSICVWRRIFRVASRVVDINHFGVFKFVPPVKSDPGFDYLEDGCNQDLVDTELTLFCPQAWFDGAIIAPGSCYYFSQPRGDDSQPTELNPVDAISVIDPGGVAPGSPQSAGVEPVSTEADDDGSGGLAGSGGEGCDERGGLNWVFCQMLRSISNGIEIIERQIYRELRIDRDDYQGRYCDPPRAAGEVRHGACNYHDAWVNMRNLMTLAVVGTAILMVIATALDVGWFSNYTVKKYLARLIAGIVLMIMSWAVGDFIISFANQLGGFAGAAITAPFGGEAAGIGLESIFNANKVGTGVAVSTVAVGAGIVGLSAGIGIVPILFTALLGILAILAGFMFLIFRQVVIIALLVFAPVGVALWFLPGSDKMWRLYYKTFLSLVFIYPIIVAVIAFGRVFIWVLLQSDTGPERSPLVATVAFLVYVGMFAAIPVLFKKFLGAVNQITGGSNNPAKGLFDRVKNARKGYMGRNKEQRQRKTDRQDDKHLAKIQQAERHGEPISRLDKIRKQGIQAKRSWRYGLPFVPIRPSSQEWLSDARRAEDAKRRADETERYKNEVTQHTNAMAESYGLDPNDFPNYVGDIEMIAGGEDPSNSGRVISGAEQEAALRILANNKSSDSFRELQGKRAGNTGLEQAWTNMVRDGTLYKEFHETDIDVAKNQIGSNNIDLGDLGDRQLQTQKEDTVKGMTGSLHKMINESATSVDVHQKVQAFAERIDRLVNNKMAVGNMPPGTSDALKDLKKVYDDAVDAGISQTSRDTTDTAYSQNWSDQQYENHLTSTAVNTTETLTAELGRRSAIHLAAEDGHEGVMRQALASDNQVVQRSLRAVVKTETLDKGKLDVFAPHLARLKLNKDGDLGKVEDFDWLEAGLDTQRLEQMSAASGEDMSKWFAANLQKARSDHVFHRNLQTYSSRYVRQAAANTWTSNPALAVILAQIDNDVTNL